MESVPANSDQLRKEMDMWDYTFKVPKDNSNTEEEKKKEAEEYLKMKEEWKKRTKKKKWTEEEDKACIDKYRQSMGERFILSVQQIFEGLDEKEPFIRLMQQLNNRKKPEISYFEMILRKKPLSDAEID